MAAPKLLGAQGHSLVVIVHPASGVEKLGGADVEAIYKSSKKRWSNGKRIVAFNFPPNNDVRTTFDKAVLRMNPSQVSRFWINQRIRGKGSSAQAGSQRLAHEARGGQASWGDRLCLWHQRSARHPGGRQGPRLPRSALKARGVSATLRARSSRANPP